MEQAVVSTVAGKKKSYAGYIIGGLVLVGGIIGVFVIKGKDDLTLWKRLTGGGAGSGDKDIPEVETPTDTPPAGTGTKWVAESFPLKKGMFGGQIKLLQQKLGAGNDGKFGSGTETKVMAKFGSPTVTKAQYDSLVNPVASGGGGNFEALRKELSGKASNAPYGLALMNKGANNIYKYQFYTDGKYLVTKDSKKVGSGRYIDGGKKLATDGGRGISSDRALVSIYRNTLWIEAGSDPHKSIS